MSKDCLIFPLLVHKSQFSLFQITESYVKNLVFHPIFFNLRLMTWLHIQNLLLLNKSEALIKSLFFSRSLNKTQDGEKILYSEWEIERILKVSLFCP